jgi:hypothetical protein
MFYRARRTILKHMNQIMRMAASCRERWIAEEEIRGKVKRV